MFCSLDGIVDLLYAAGLVDYPGVRLGPPLLLDDLLPAPVVVAVLLYGQILVRAGRQVLNNRNNKYFNFNFIVFGPKYSSMSRFNKTLAQPGDSLLRLFKLKARYLNIGSLTLLKV